MAKGKEKEKRLIIGEAGVGHSFASEAEGPIEVSVGGETSSLLSKTIFASKIQENILSVGETTDCGYTMMFNKNGVYLYKDVEVRGEPLLVGTRSKQNHLYYFDLTQNTKTPMKSGVLLRQTATLPRSPMMYIPVLSYARLRQTQKEREENKLAPGEDVYFLDAISKLSRTYHECKSDFDLWHPRMAHVNPRMALLSKPDLKDWPKKCFCVSCKGSFINTHTLEKDLWPLMNLGHQASTYVVISLALSL